MAEGTVFPSRSLIIGAPVAVKRTFGEEDPPRLKANADSYAARADVPEDVGAGGVGGGDVGRMTTAEDAAAEIAVLRGRSLTLDGRQSRNPVC